MGFDIWRGHYEHEQTVSTATWTIPHGMGIQSPIVDVWIDNNGTFEKMIPANIEATDTNTVVVTFSSAFAGKATVC